MVCSDDCAPECGRIIEILDCEGSSVHSGYNSCGVVSPSLHCVLFYCPLFFSCSIDLGIDEDDDEPIPLPNVNGAIMKKVCVCVCVCVRACVRACVCVRV